MKEQEKIKADKMDFYEPRTYGQRVFLDCSDCGSEYEWLMPFTASSTDDREEFDPMKTCKMWSCVPQRRCIKCQVKLRIKQAKEKHDN